MVSVQVAEVVREPSFVALRQDARRPAVIPRVVSVAPAARFEGLDAVRLLAAYSTVLVHGAIAPATVALVTPLTRFSLPFFVQAAVYFLFRGMERHRDLTYREHLRHRTWRLLVPFAAWNAVYTGMRVAKHSLLLHDGTWPLQWSYLWIGSSMHLWFLPFLLIVSAFVLAVAEVVKRRPWLAMPLAVVLFALGTVHCLQPGPGVQDLGDGASYFWERSFFMLPSVCWAMAWGVIRMRKLAPAATHDPSKRAAGAGAALVIAATVVLYFAEPYGVAFRLARHAVGIAWLLFAFAPVRNVILTHLASLGRYSYGIFLVHVALLQIHEFAIERWGFAPSLSRDLVLCLLTIAAATAIAPALARWKTTRWLCGQ